MKNNNLVPIKISLLFSLFVLSFLTACSSSSHLKIDITKYTLPNGLHVILAPQKNLKFSTVLITYNVGGYTENLSILGTSHLLEHLMFQSTSHLKRGEFNTIIEQEMGGSFNAMTTYDATTFYSVIPITGVAKVLKLEADRMNNLIFVPDEVKKEKQVVLEEMRYRIENSDTGFLADRANRLFFSNTYPYGRDLGGTVKVFTSLKDSTIKAYYKSHYGVNNATLIITGGINIDSIKKEIQTAFGDCKPIQLQKANTNIDYTPKKGTFEIIRPTKTNYVLMMAKTPKITNNLIPALNLLGNLLTQGNNSYLQSLLVKEKQLVSSVSAAPDMSLMPASFSIVFTPYNISKMTEIENMILNTIKNLKNEKNLPQRIEQQQLSNKTQFYDSLQNSDDLAFNLAQGVVLNKDPLFYINLITQKVSQKDLIKACDYLIQNGFTNFFIKKSDTPIPPSKD